MHNNYRPVVLIIIDGFGVPEEKSISTRESVPPTQFRRAGKIFSLYDTASFGNCRRFAVGRAGQQRVVGHLTIGAGKIIHNYLPKISSAIKDGSFFENPAFAKAIDHIKRPADSFIFMGLYSTGTVHAYFEHLARLA